ncbi:MAG: zinc-ribbon domain-containing protein [Thermoplasmata archaeon]
MVEVDTTTIVVIVAVIVLAVLTYFELKYLRKSSHGRRIRTRKRDGELPDEAHNALITTKAIVATMERGGIRSEEVDQLMRDAQLAHDRRNYRVTNELTTQARNRLMALKSAQTPKGDLAKLEAMPTTADEPTTKEVLQKEFPPNLVQAKFAMSVAESFIEQGKGNGRDISRAELLLSTAKSRFDAQDYSGSLSVARQAEKSARGEAVEMPPPIPGPASTPSGTPPPPVATVGRIACPSCGAPLKPDDTFCRKCGAKVVLTACPNCRAELLADDIFCRKCGTRIER